MSPRVAHFPSLASLSANPYWYLLGQGLQQRGWELDEKAASRFGAHWLRENRGEVHVLHFHFVQPWYVYETVHARLGWVLRFARNLLLARLWGYRVVFTLHDLTPSYPLRPGWVDYLGHWIAANLSNSVIVHCEDARKSLRKRYGRRHGVYTVSLPSYGDTYPNTISRATARHQLGIRADAFVFLFFGGLRPNKGLETLCAEFAKLVDPSARLIIAGAASPDARYMAKLRLDASQDNRITLKEGYVPDDEVQVLMNAADAVVLPFARVLTSTSALLALSFGKPVVAPAMGCLPELVSEQTGILYDPHDSHGLLKAMERIRRSDVAAMGRFAAKEARELCLDRFILGTLQAYLGATCG